MFYLAYYPVLNNGETEHTVKIELWLQWTSSGPGEMSLGIQFKQNCGYSGPTVVTVDQQWAW